MSKRRVVVTGLGIVSPVGNDHRRPPGTASSRAAAASARSPTSTPRPSPPASPARCATSIRRAGSRRRTSRRWTPSSSTASPPSLDGDGRCRARDHRGQCRPHRRPRSAPASAASRGIEKTTEAYLQRRPAQDLAVLRAQHHHQHAAGPAVRSCTGIKGPNLSAVSACTTATHTIGMAMRLIQYGDADVMVAGGAECSTTPTAIGGFIAARRCRTRNDDPTRASRPWDKDRDGFVLCDGAGVLVLEEYEHAKARGARIYAELAGFGMCDDAYHMTAPPRGRRRARRAACATRCAMPASTPTRSSTSTRTRTSTPLGDVAETRAIEAVLRRRTPTRLMVSSTKSMTGHLLGAAGGVEAIFSVLALHDGVIPPTINLDDARRRLRSRLRAEHGARRKLDRRPWSRTRSASAAPTARWCSGASERQRPRAPRHARVARPPRPAGGCSGMARALSRLLLESVAGGAASARWDILLAPRDGDGRSVQARPDAACSGFLDRARCRVARGAGRARRRGAAVPRRLGCCCWATNWPPSASRGCACRWTRRCGPTAIALRSPGRRALRPCARPHDRWSPRPARTHWLDTTAARSRPAAAATCARRLARHRGGRGAAGALPRRRAAHARLPRRRRRVPGQPVARLARGLRSPRSIRWRSTGACARPIRRRSRACSAHDGSGRAQLLARSAWSRSRGRRVQTRPIAGTRPRLAGDDEAARMRELIDHPKERAEHVMLIDLERNDLGRVCVPGSVAVDEMMTVESYAHVHHIVSNVRGTLRRRRDAGPGDRARCSRAAPSPAAPRCAACRSSPSSRARRAGLHRLARLPQPRRRPRSQHPDPHDRDRRPARGACAPAAGSWPTRSPSASSTKPGPRRAACWRAAAVRAMNATSRCLVDGLATDRVGADDRGLAYGDGVFETMRWRARRGAVVAATSRAPRAGLRAPAHRRARPRAVRARDRARRRRHGRGAW